jgi:hypothetical protein
VKRTLEWSKILSSERKGIWATDHRAFERRDKGVHVSKIKYTINSILYKNIANKSQETPEKVP